MMHRYPKLESSSAAGDGGGGGSSGKPAPPPKMKRYVRSVVQANKGKAAFNRSGDLAAGAMVYAKWYGPEREKYPDWCVASD